MRRWRPFLVPLVGVVVVGALVAAIFLTYRFAQERRVDIGTRIQSVETRLTAVEALERYDPSGIQADVATMQAVIDDLRSEISAARSDAASARVATRRLEQAEPPSHDWVVVERRVDDGDDGYNWFELIYVLRYVTPQGGTAEWKEPITAFTDNRELPDVIADSQQRTGACFAQARVGKPLPACAR